MVRTEPFKIELCLYGFCVLPSFGLDLTETGISPSSLAICFKPICRFSVTKAAFHIEPFLIRATHLTA
jgi:hypothetical protein